MTRKRRQLRAGFTLLEVLIALVIVAIISAGLAGSLHVAFKARRSALDGISSIKSARIALDAVARDLGAALPPTGVLAGSFTANADTALGDLLTFYNASESVQTTQGKSDIQQVTLTLENDAGQYTLVRRVNKTLLAPVDETPPDQVLCRHVQSLTLRYYDGSQWLDSWDSTANDNTLPLAVEATLELANQSGLATDRPYTLSRIIRLPCGVASATSTSGATP